MEPRFCSQSLDMTGQDVGGGDGRILYGVHGRIFTERDAEQCLGGDRTD